MLEGNLPQDHWETCMRCAEFILARLPNLASDYEAAQQLDTLAHYVGESIRAATAIVYEDKTLALTESRTERENLVAQRVILEANKAKKRKDLTADLHTVKALMNIYNLFVIYYLFLFKPN